MQIANIFSKPGTGAHFLMREPRPDVAFTPDDQGYWEHPDFRWALVPPDASVAQYLTDAGYEFTSIERDDAIGDLDQGCVGWVPEPLGYGWILILVLGTEDGPQAVFARQLFILSKNLNMKRIQWGS
jgi:hypothetical protein